MLLAGQKVLVTGATGFIGAHVARRLVEEKCSIVRALVRDPAKAEPLRRLGAEIVVGDLADVASLQKAAEGCRVVIHSAAQVAALPTRNTFEETNRQGTENLLGAASEAGVAKFVHLSSIAVFGLATSGEITDESPRGHCGDSYCDTKFDAEERVWRHIRENRLPITILRPSAVYGPGSTHWCVIPLKRIKKGKMFLVDQGRGSLNYVYIDNLVDAILLAAEDDRGIGEAFIVNDGATTLSEFFNAYARMAGRPPIRSMPLWLAKGWVHYRNALAVFRRESTRVPPNALGFLTGQAVYKQSRIERVLGHRSRVDLGEGMRRTELWFRETGLIV